MIAVIGSIVGFAVACAARVVGGFADVATRRGLSDSAAAKTGHGSLGCCDFSASSFDTAGSPPVTGTLHWIVNSDASAGSGGVDQRPFSSVVTIASGKFAKPMS